LSERERRELDTPEKRRAWIESYSGFGEISEKLNKLGELTYPFMKKADVVAAVTTDLGEDHPIERDRIIWFGRYYFVFDENDQLVSGPSWESDSDVETESAD
jgi:hypothetical protein